MERERRCWWEEGGRVVERLPEGEFFAQCHLESSRNGFITLRKSITDALRGQWMPSNRPTFFFFFLGEKGGNVSELVFERAISKRNLKRGR